MASSLQRLARKKARKYGLDPNVFVAQINQESGFNPNARSPVGATGIAQIMPATAKAWGVNPNKPRQALDAAAKHMAGYVHQFGSYENALRAYNAGPGNVKASHGFSETNNYVKSILSGRTPQGASSGQVQPGGSQVTGLRFGADQIGTRNVLDSAAFKDAQRKAQVGAWYASKHPGSILASVLPQTPPDPADFTDQQLTFKAGGLRGARSTTFGGADTTGQRLGRVVFSPSADRAGVHTRKPIKRFARAVAGIAGRTLEVGTGTNHSQMTVNGNVSDHWSGNAVDVPATGAELLELGRAALIAAGMPRRKALKQKGGLFNVNGHQIIFNTMEGGDHTTHLHISAR
jgi:hypothetical protein